MRLTREYPLLLEAAQDAGVGDLDGADRLGGADVGAQVEGVGSRGQHPDETVTGGPGVVVGGQVAPGHVEFDIEDRKSVV